MVMGCIVGPIIGVLISILFIWLVFLPLEAHFDPEGFNYGAVYQMLFIIGAFTVFGCVGGFMAHARLRNRGSRQVPPGRSDLSAPDERIWPPPPNPPTV